MFLRFICVGVVVTSCFFSMFKIIHKNIFKKAKRDEREPPKII